MAVNSAIVLPLFDELVFDESEDFLLSHNRNSVIKLKVVYAAVYLMVKFSSKQQRKRVLESESTHHLLSIFCNLDKAFYFFIAGKA
jgi:hypothetical protein